MFPQFLLQFFYVLKGKLLFQVDNQEFILMPSSSINIPEGEFLLDHVSSIITFMPIIPSHSSSPILTSLCRLHLLHQEHTAHQSRGLFLHTLHWKCPTVVNCTIVMLTIFIILTSLILFLLLLVPLYYSTCTMFVDSLFYYMPVH